MVPLTMTNTADPGACGGFEEGHRVRELQCLLAVRELEFACDHLAGPVEPEMDRGGATAAGVPPSGLWMTLTTPNVVRPRRVSSAARGSGCALVQSPPKRNLGDARQERRPGTAAQTSCHGRVTELGSLPVSP